jgi:hypothetical protein
MAAGILAKRALAPALHRLPVCLAKGRWVQTLHREALGAG